MKKPPDSGKTGNEGIQRIPPETVRQAGLILLFAEKLAALVSDRDEHDQIGILTSGFNLAPAFPRFRAVAMRVCSPLQWRNRLRFSRSSQPPDRVQLTTFKERGRYEACGKFCKRKNILPAICTGFGEIFIWVAAAVSGKDSSWCIRRDSNPQPSDPKSEALSN